MLRYGAALAIVVIVALRPPGAQKPADCLHGRSEAPAQAERRKAALRLARELNTLEAAAHAQAQSYYTMTDLPGVPAVPGGFRAQLSTDGASYTFSVKDTLDACGFAFFSDQEGVIYSGTPIQ